MSNSISITPIGSRISKWGEGPIFWNDHLLYVDIEGHALISLDPKTETEKVWEMGDQNFEAISTSKLHGLSNKMMAYQRMVKLFPEPMEAKTNSWFCQPLFRNSNLKTKIQNRNRRGFKMLSVTPEHLGLPANLTINLNELYEGGVFKSDTELENLIKLNGNIHYQIEDNTRIALLHENPPKYSSSNLSNLMGKIKKGSKKFRGILARNQNFYYQWNYQKLEQSSENYFSDRGGNQECLQNVPLE